MYSDMPDVLFVWIALMAYGKMERYRNGS